MVDEGLIGALVLAGFFVYRRAIFGRPPARPLRLLPGAIVSTSIHIGFHAAATVAPSAPTAIALVLFGWASFLLWWRWMSRAPYLDWNEDEGGGGAGGGGGSDGGGGGGGPGGDRPDDPHSDPGGIAREIDWDALEREMSDFIGERELVGAR